MPEHPYLQWTLFRRSILAAFQRSLTLKDATDPTAASIRIGLMDLDPSRVLRQCEHIFLKVGPAGLVSQWLKMPTAGTKIIHCTKHGYALAAADLDEGYAALRAAIAIVVQMAPRGRRRGSTATNGRTHRTRRF